MGRVVATLCLVVLSGASAQAASPSLGGTTPRGAQRGTEIEVVLSGAQLNDAQEVLFYEPGIEVTKLEVVNPTTVKALFKISPEAMLGSHRLRVRTATGVSELRPFFVGALPEVAEKEPNSDFAAPQPIPMNVTVNGVADNEDVDYFVVEAKKGDRISAEVEGIRLGITLFDAYVAIMNTARFELSSSDDNALVWQDGVASIIAPEDGKYIIQIRESSYAGNGACLYRLHVGNFPRPTALLPAGGRYGETLPVKFIGDVLGDREATLTLPTDRAANFSVFAKDDKGIAPSQNWFRLSDLPNVIEQEPNETHDNATRFAAPVALNGILEKPGDSDNFRFTAKKGEAYDIRVHARSIRSPLDPVLTISAAGGGAIAANDDTGGPDSFIRFGVPNDGDYVVNVRDHLNNGGPSYVYRIELTPIQPKLVLTTNEFVQYVQPVVAVPKGNHFGLVLSAQRFDFGGPLALRGENLPAGVTLEAPPMPANAAVVPVLFHATPEAAASGKLAEVIGSLVDPNQPNLKVEGGIQQPIVLVRGLNQIPFWTENTNKLPVVVTEEAPFELAIVEPKVPLVRGGQMDLKVVAKRKEGFKAAIKIDMLWLPPGIGASGSIAIAEGQNEAVIPMNAAGNAELATWKIAVRGEANSGNGNIMVSTPFANLRIAEMYMTLAFEQAAVEQGKETELVVHMTKQFDFPGVAKVNLIGLPNKAVTTTQDATVETKDLVFKITTDMTTPAGNHANLFCQIIVTENGEPVIHNIGTGKLRVDVPLPPKKDAPPPPPMPTPTPAPAAEKPPEPKRLTRLEQLRLEQQEREKAKKGGAAPAAPPK
ncbi:MAG: PPC domain-containing protein [Planctomycetes bacterium]|nr:PPC domain-containing protein [Planctomycetota bacterium]